MQILLIIIILLFLSNKTSAQTDSLKSSDSTTEEIHEFHKDWYESRYIRESILPLSLAPGSVAIITIPGLKESL